jgi:lipopolysaccharide/colanic/teichoic acid biosynthesis glycosyltransferase
MRFEMYGNDKVLWQSEVMTQDPKKPGTQSLRDDSRILKIGRHLGRKRHADRLLDRLLILGAWMS